MTTDTCDQDGGGHQVVGVDPTGFRGEALDARPGRVERHIEDGAWAHLPVAAGAPVSGDHLPLPPSVVARIDVEDESVRLNRTLAVVEGSPEVAPRRAHDPLLRHEADAYYC
ncbi:hypothetical protein ACIRBX_22650 [Kitasatospora sp. NPDC096147]|uniref:hypothetical protein n=1 Tax=Kitasatospora sp. NPDC096147 TaxID=3364093 RepID=UPI00381FF0E8